MAPFHLLTRVPSEDHLAMRVKFVGGGMQKPLHVRARPRPQMHFPDRQVPNAESVDRKHDGVMPLSVLFIRVLVYKIAAV
jgi:hypothetical protein